MADILDELAAALARGRNDYPRQPPLSHGVPDSRSGDPVSLPPVFGDPRFSLEMSGGYGWNPRQPYQSPFGRQILQSILGGGFPVPAYQQGQFIDPRQPLQPQGSISSEGWQPGVSLRARFPF